MIIITDHALLRFIERAKGISLDPLRKELEALIAPAAQAGAESYSIDGYTYCFTRSGPRVTLATVIEKSTRSNTRKSRKRVWDRLRESA